MKNVTDFRKTVETGVDPIIYPNEFCFCLITDLQ